VTYERVEIYAVNVMRALDVLLNAMTGGDRTQTISDRVGDKARRGRLWARIADRVFLGHFTATTEESRGKEIYVSSLSMLLGGVALTGAVYAAWRWPGAVMLAFLAYLAALLAIVLVALIRHRGRLP